VNEESTKASEKSRMVPGESDPGSLSPGALCFLAGGGEMGERIRRFDWSKTPLGPIEHWSQSLKTAVRIMLGSRYQMFVWWGEDLINIYNDAYANLLGRRHPSALGQRAERLWHEIWHISGPQAQTVLRENRASWNDRVRLIMERNDYREEMFATWSYSPLPDDEGGVGGVLCVCYEETERVLSERRLVTLRRLADETTAAQSAEQACLLAAKTLEQNSWDISFSLIYLLEPDGSGAQLTASIGVEPGTEAAPERVHFAKADGAGLWPFDRMLHGERVKITELAQRAKLPGGAWPEPTHTAMALPLAKGVQDQPSGFVVLGASPRLPFDDAYQGFFELLSTNIASAIAKARVLEEERKRVEALAEIDRAKTAFFSNVSHEFRTPLTLLLGPLEETLAQSGDLAAANRDRLEIARRNSLRLLKLVNTLLDFSRIEAGRIQAVYQPTDLGAYTAELASVFRSAIEKAGLQLVIDCPSLPDSVWVDQEMWEKIVLNLLSNAFKFTFEGAISVSLRRAGEMVELAVSDTGTGIAADEVPHLFERFHRVKGARGRSLEGSGIGLALVQELVKLHGGAVRVQSQVEHGSTFTVTIPLGAADLPADHVETAGGLPSTGLRGEVYVEEVLSWLPGVQGGNGAGSTPDRAHSSDGNSLPRILLADDNADMREYVGRLLSRRCEVEAVTDGVEALNAAREHTPDLVLTDVMMPRLDGFGLLKELRADERLKTVPVILLSARAGEEASVEGIESGADDYLVKPFSARELVARVEAHLKMASLRAQGEAVLRESEANLRLNDQRMRGQKEAFQAAINGASVEDSLHMLTRMVTEETAGEARTAFYIADPDGTRLHPIRGAGSMPEEYTEQVDGFVIGKDSLACGLTAAVGRPVLTRDVFAEPLWEPWVYLARGYRFRACWSFPIFPITAGDGRPVGTFAMYFTSPREAGARDLALADVVTQAAGIIISRNIEAQERARAERALRESEEHFRLLVDNVQEYALFQTDTEGTVTSWNPGAERLFGYSSTEMLGHSFSRLLTVEDQQAGVLDQELACVPTGIGWRDERWLVRKDGSRFWAQSITEPVHDEAGRLRGGVKVTRDETERKRSDERQSLLMAELNHRVKNTLATVQSIATQTLRGSTDPRQFVENFKARIQALSRAHSLLTRSSWKSADVTDLVHDQLTMDGDIDRITVRGPAALLTPQSTVALSLVLHELGTNARKYGALAAPTGRLDVHWRIEPPGPRLHIEWAETGGPPVVEPQKRGFGTTLIERSLGGVGGSAELRFNATGLQCAIDVQLSPMGNRNTEPPEVV
jgi:PAS domain S-box-containing protein